MYEAELFGVRVRIAAPPELFSPQAADRGTLAMVSQVQLLPGQRLLDLGCGAGLVGIAAAKVLGESAVILTDADPAAVRCARENAVRNGLPGLRVVQGDALNAVEETGFDWILSNPPYHADFSVPKRFIEKGFNRLKIGGCLVMVVKRLPWYRNKLTAVFGGVRVREVDGYYVLTAQRRALHYAEKKVKPRKG